jgi:hypothetical protein
MEGKPDCRRTRPAQPFLTPFARASRCKRRSHNRLPTDLFDHLVGDGEQARANQE